MIINMCIKFGFNTLIFSKDIERKPFFQSWNFFQIWKRAIIPKITGGFTKSNLTYILWLYTCVLNFNLIHQSLQKISHGNHLCYLRDRRTGWTYVRTAVILYALPPPPPSPPPHWKGRGHNKFPCSRIWDVGMKSPPNQNPTWNKTRKKLRALTRLGQHEEANMTI